MSVKLVRDVLLAHEGESFQLKQGKAFTYKVKGNSIVPDTTNYQVPIKDIIKGLNRGQVERVADIKDLWGSSYIYALINDGRIRNNIKC